MSEASIAYNSTTYAKHTLPSLTTSSPLHLMEGLTIIMIQLRTRAFPTLRRLLAHTIPSINEQYHKSCPSCDHSVPESVTHLLFECPRRNRYRKQLDEEIPDFPDFFKKEAYSHYQRVVFLLGGVPNDLEKSPELSESKRLWKKSLPHIVTFVLRLLLTSARHAFLREEGLIPGLECSFDYTLEWSACRLHAVHMPSGLKSTSR